MSELTFNNRPNFKVTDAEGNEYWISRSIAICAPIFFKTPQSGDLYLPLGLRSKNLELYPEHWGIVAGFLDWDEDLAGCVTREYWEELRLDPGAYRPVPKHPNYVFSEPLDSENQTVTMRFTYTIYVHELPDLIPGEEVLQAKWCNVSREEHRTMKLAFNHLEIIDWAVNYLQENSYRERQKG